MDYKIEDIFQVSGQYDKVVTVEFKKDSESREKYGNHITGVFIYTPKERKLLEERIAIDGYEGTDGSVKFNELLNAIPEELRKELLEAGIPNSEIDTILQSKNKSENLYKKAEVKDLPKALEIKVDFSDWDDDMTLGLYNKYIEDGYQLCPFENDENIALILLRISDDNPQKQKIIADFTDPNTGELKSSIRLEYLTKKYATEVGLSEEENKELYQIMEGIAEERGKILKSELQKSSEKFKELGINYPDNLARIVAISSSFKPQRLTHNKKPVWWDYERFIHIYMRHVAEIQIGERFEDKTPFQYAFKDIQRLVVNVLKTVEDEIQLHFENTPDKSFKRHGEMSVYYQGDYYVIDIAPDGRLMTFYKKE